MQYLFDSQHWKVREGEVRGSGDVFSENFHFIMQNNYFLVFPNKLFHDCRLFSHKPKNVCQLSQQLKYVLVLKTTAVTLLHAQILVRAVIYVLVILGILAMDTNFVKVSKCSLYANKR